VTPDVLGSAAADLVAALRAWARDLRFDDDQDPALDTPAQRLARAFDRCAAIAGALEARDVFPRAITGALMSEGSASNAPLTGEHVIVSGGVGTYFVWPEDGSEADARSYVASSVVHAAERRAAQEARRAWPIAYHVRGDGGWATWRVIVDRHRTWVVVALGAQEVPMPPATHVLWCSHILCEDPRLRSFPCDWPRDQHWVSLKSVADGIESPADRCASCWDKAPRYIDEIRKVAPR
jgi:hypothetical protein